MARNADAEMKGVSFKLSCGGAGCEDMASYGSSRVLRVPFVEVGGD